MATHVEHMKTILMSGFWVKGGEVTRLTALAQFVLFVAVLLTALGAASWHS